jgi:hypothetical protein
MITITTDSVSKASELARQTVQELRKAFLLSFKQHWTAKKAAASSIEGGPQVPTTLSAQPPQRRLLLFYEQEIEHLLQKDVSKNGKSIQDIQSVLKRRENRHLFIRGLILTARDDIERHETKDFLNANWRACMVIVGEMPCKMDF